MKVLVFAPPAFTPENLDGDGFLEVPDSATLDYVLRQMKMPKLLAKILLVSVNGQIASGRVPLQEGDSIGFVSGLAGG